MTNCTYCVKPFTPTRHWQKFCPGGECKRLWHAEQRAATKAQHPANGKNPAAVALGKRRMALLTKQQRSALGKAGAKARIEKQKKMRDTHYQTERRG